MRKPFDVLAEGHVPEATLGSRVESRFRKSEQLQRPQPPGASRSPGRRPTGAPQGDPREAMVRQFGGSQIVHIRLEGDVPDFTRVFGDIRQASARATAPGRREQRPPVSWLP